MSTTYSLWSGRLRRAVVVWSLSAWLVAALHASPPFAFIIVGTFLTVCPGAAFARSVRRDDPIALGVIVVGASFALDALVAEALFYADAYTGARAVAILAVIAIVGASWPRPAARAILPPVSVTRSNGAPGDEPPAKSGTRPVPRPVQLDPSVPVLLVRIGRYPVFHGAVGAIRTFGRAGVPVFAIVEDTFTPAAMSRYLSGAIKWPTNGDEAPEYLLEGLANIGKLLGGGVIAVPTDDEAAVFLAEHGDVLRQWFTYPEVDPALPARLASKRGLNELCLEHDVPTPETVAPTSTRDIETFAKRATYPVVVKNVDPWLRLHEPAVRGTTFVQSEDDLLALAATFPAPSAAIFQEFIPEAAAEDWIYHGYFDIRSRAQASFTGVKLRSWPPRAGVTTYARVVENDELRRLSERFCNDIGYRGVADLDWRFDRRDGRYKLVDFNPRVGAQFRLFEDEAGLDVLRAMHLDLTGRTVPGASPEYGRGIVVEHLDLPAKLAYRHRPANAPEGAREGRRPERAWFATDDITPFLMMIVRFARPAFARIVSDRRKRKAIARAKRGEATSTPASEHPSEAKVPAGGAKPAPSAGKQASRSKR